MTRVREDSEVAESQDGITRRRAVGYLIAAPFLVTGARFVNPSAASAAVPTKQTVDHYDLSNLLIDSTRPTQSLIKVAVKPDGTVAFDMPRSENGQGIDTACAMIIADELDVSLSSVKVTLADAKPELVFNQFTAGSVSTQELYQPLRTAAALARGRMAAVAADQLGVAESELKVADGKISAGGRSLGYGELSRAAAVSKTRRARKVKPKRKSQRVLVGKGQRRVDGRDIVTGRKKYAMDLDVKNALPTMLCRPPTINGNAEAVLNMERVKAMPGVTDVVLIPSSNDERAGVVPGGVAVRARTFGQCIDAIRAMKVRWSDGSAAGKNADTVLADLRKAELPLTPGIPDIPGLPQVKELAPKQVEEEFVFHFRPGDPLEPNTAVADVRKDKAEVWAPLKSPIWFKERIAAELGLPLDKVAVHVTPGGGSFGRRLFCDAPFEAVAVSKAMGKPVRLMWHRADMPRQGRAHPMAISRVRLTHTKNEVVACEQRHTSVMTDFTQGLGEILTASSSTPPLQNYLQYSQTVFNLTANVPYDFGVVNQQLNEIYDYNTFNTSSVRNIYSPEVRTAVELMTDKVAADMGKDPFAFRQQFARFDRLKAVLARLKKESQWGRKLGAGRAQGVAVHNEYHGFVGCVVEIDTRRKTVNRKIAGAVTGPRVTRVTFVVDVGLPINPLGLKAQMMGGIVDGIGQVLTYGLHLKDGAFLEASWDNAFYSRHWNAPPRVDVIVMPPTGDPPGGAGEFGVAASMAATACALGRATGKMPKEFPVNQHKLGFKPYPAEPPIPASPTNGLRYRDAPKQR